MGYLALLVIIGLFHYSNAQGPSPPVFNVLDNGAKGDGKTDSTNAFNKTWDAACNAGGPNSKMVVPAQNTFLLRQITFKGPCKTQTITVEIGGTLLAPNTPAAWKGLDSAFWISFDSVTGVTVDGLGTGTFDGSGKVWWDQSCRYHPDLAGCTQLAPTSLKFCLSKEITLTRMMFKQSPQTHVLFFGVDAVNISNVNIDSPADSPNTDGIHVQYCNGMNINNCTIKNGDDNISIGDRTLNLQISNIVCGPGGHGISVGSLGRDGGQVEVRNIHVSNVTFTDTTNGARIKTWQVGKGIVQNITYENIVFNNCEAPIVIDQNYCEVRGACKEKTTGVQISDVLFKSFSGTSKLVETIQLQCSKAVPCQGITMDSIDLAMNAPGTPGGQAQAICSDAHGTEIGIVKPGPCLLPGRPAAPTAAPTGPANVQEL